MAYDPDKIEVIFTQICEQIETGRSLRSILKEDDNMPSSSTFFIWLKEDTLKSKRYELATDLRTDILFDEIIEIAYNVEEGTTTKEFLFTPNNLFQTDTVVSRLKKSSFVKSGRKFPLNLRDINSNNSG